VGGLAVSRTRPPRLRLARTLLWQIGYLEARHWTWANHLILWGTIAFWFLFQAVYSQMPRLSYVAYGLSAALWRNSKFPFTVLLVVAAALLPDCVYNYVCMAWHPSDPQLVHEMAWVRARVGACGVAAAAQALTSSRPGAGRRVGMSRARARRPSGKGRVRCSTRRTWTTRPARP